MKPRKQFRILTLFHCALIIVLNAVSIIAQPVSITVPDYSFGMINSEYGTVTTYGVANPGPDGGYSVEEAARTSGVAFAHGYRWWGYGSTSIACGPYPEFNFPGDHGVYNMWVSGCINPPTGFMGSWGGVVIEPASRKIWCLIGAKKEGGPTKSYCIPNPYGPGEMCYGVPSIWGRGESFGYLRKVVVIKSTGTLQKGDPVNVKVKISQKGDYEGGGTVTSQGVLMLNRPGNPMEYMRWHDMSDFLSGMVVLTTDLGKKNDSSSVVLAIGDTIKIEVGYNNTVKHANPGSSSEAEGWVGMEPKDLTENINYARTDSIRKIIKKYGNNLTYDLICLTAGAILEPATAGGPNLDEDKDGMSDAQEKGPDADNNLWDGNGDAIPDYKQANAASFHTYDGQNYVTLVVPLGTVLSQMKVTDNPSKSDTPADAQFPFGFFDFSIDGLDPGEAVTVTLILHNASSINKYYKYGPTPENILPHWYEFTYNGQTGVQINGNTITLHFVDGLRGDEDLTINGSIKEPGGPAIAGTTGVTETDKNSNILIYPNPAKEFITLRINNIVPANDYVINIYSVTGTLVHKKVINVIGHDQQFIIPVGHFPEGIYLISLSSGNLSYNSKFSKLK